MLLSQWLPAIILIPTCSAFYPYHHPSPDPSLYSRNQHTEPRNPNNNILRLPLHKVRTKSRSKRSNTFSIVSAISPTTPDSLPIDEDGNDISYMSSFTLGTSQTPILLLLDTAASNTWLMSSTCPTHSCALHDTFGPSSSTTLKINDSQDFAVTYGTGSVSGVVASDALRCGAFSVPLTFGLATNVSDDFSAYPMDGILGLGRADLVAQTARNVPGPSLMDVLISQNVIKSKIVGVHLWRDSSAGRNNGEVTFGALDSSMFEGEINYVDAVGNGDGFWEVPVADAGVDGKSAGLSGNTAILDTGTSFILMPQAHAAKLHALVPDSANPGGGESFTVPCGTQNTVQLTFNGVVYGILPADYVGTPVAQGSSTCYSNIVGRQTFNATQWLVGDVFLKNVYSVFDFDEQRLGFGVKAGDGDNPSSSSGGSSATAMGSISSGSPPKPTGSVTEMGIVPSMSSTGKGSGSGTTSATPTSSVEGSHTNEAAGSVIIDGYKLAIVLYLMLILW